MRAQRKKYEKPVLQPHGSINRFISGASSSFTDYDSVIPQNFPNAVCSGMGFIPASPPIMCI